MFESVCTCMCVYGLPAGHGTCECGGVCECDTAPSGKLYTGEICECYPDEDVCRASNEDVSVCISEMYACVHMCVHVYVCLRTIVGLHLCKTHMVNVLPLASHS